MELQWVGAQNLKREASPARTANGQPRPRQRPDSEGGDLSAEGREGEEGRQSRASLALLQRRQGRGNSCSGVSG